MTFDHVHLLSLFTICLVAFMINIPVLVSITCLFFMIRTIYILQHSEEYWKNVSLIILLWYLFWYYL